MGSSGDESMPGALTTDAAIATYVAEKMAQPERRGRPPTHGKFIGLGKVRVQLQKMRAEEKDRALDKVRQKAYAAATKRRTDSEASGRSSDAESVKRLRRSCLTVGGTDVEVECETRATIDLVDLLYKAINVCDEVAGRAKNLKGTDLKALRMAGRDGRRVADTLYVRLRDEPGARTAPVLPQVYQQNEDLRREVKQLQDEVVALTAKVRMPPPPPPPPAQERLAEDALLERISALIDAKLAALNLPAQGAGRASLTSRGGGRDRRSSREGARSVPKARAKAKAATKAKPKAQPPVPLQPAKKALGPSSSTTGGEEPWSTVVGRKARRAAGSAVSAAPGRPTKGGASAPVAGATAQPSSA
ncbi:uncharacterized protein LOC109861257 [Pseudomyrmex gracilis]|uniref:uncharacterized protein LOC109861257 n=1 Tax=Pseudomyrmex gracilis TaxID=219809 RepID=UPI000995226A|nr:uncharacterized protein LOC109861257 [Pseudomyrmex gracilis]